tara:strand:+ start:4081 stop:4632 length:552 start_codon:yes stop_codon:yes gene_type:complete
MKLTLVGKRVERMNKFGDDLKMELKDNGSIKFSPALLSRMGVSKDSNRFGIAYSDSDNAYLYLAPDNKGVAINAQGISNNMPHNRDLRSTYNLPSTGKISISVKEETKTFDDFSNYKFYEIYIETEESLVSLEENLVSLQETSTEDTYVDNSEETYDSFTDATVVEPISQESNEDEDTSEDIW